MHRHAMDRANPPTRILMACLGDASRFRLVKVLIGGQRCVTDLAAEVGLSQSCTTRHLQALEKRRVVEGTRVGKKVMYRLRHEEPGLDPLLAWALMPGRGAARARSDSIPSGGGARERSGRRPPTRSVGPVATERPAEPERVATVPGASEASPRPAEPISRRTDGQTADTPEVGPDPGERARGIAPTRTRPPRAELEDYLL